MLSVVACDGFVYRFLCRPPVGYGVELRRLSRSRRATPVDQVAVVAAVGVERQCVVGQKSPAFGVGWHPEK